MGREGEGAVTIGISRSLAFQDHTESVSVDAYGTNDHPPGPEVIARAAGMIFAAGEAALAVDPYGKPDVRAPARARPLDGQTMRVTIRLLFTVSSDDVLAGGPIHRERASEVARAMYKALEERF
jgi:hypothetical protein